MLECVCGWRCWSVGGRRCWSVGCLGCLLVWAFIAESGS